MRIDKEIKVARAELIFPFVEELLRQGKQVRLTVTGSSMYPFLRENIDSVELSGCAFSDLRKGDIALIRRENGQYILHRVLQKTAGSFFIAGDAQQWVEGPLFEGQLIAAAKAVYRSDNRISCTGRLWTISALLWLYLLPFRGVLIACFKKLRKVNKGFIKFFAKFILRRPSF